MTTIRCAHCDSDKLELQLKRAKARNRVLKRKLADIEALMVRRLHSWSGEFNNEGAVSKSRHKKDRSRYGAISLVLGEVRQVIHGNQYAEDMEEIQ